MVRRYPVVTYLLLATHYPLAAESYNFQEVRGLFSVSVPGRWVKFIPATGREARNNQRRDLQQTLGRLRSASFKWAEVSEAERLGLAAQLERCLALLA